jgi:regulation of enolase protein 1 (concanavalin A-like superfamily)
LPKRLIQGGALSAVVVVCALVVGAGRVSAQSLPTGWANRDVGSVGLPGSASAISGTWTVDASGANIWGSADEQHFAYQAVTGDLDIRVRLASLEKVDNWSKAGVMIRESLATNARNAFMLATPGGTRGFQVRTTVGGSTRRTNGASGTGPIWLRLVRQGSQFTGYLSADGASWTTVGSSTISMTSTVYVGLAVTSRKDSTLATATFTNLTVSAGTGATSPSLPAPWTAGDIGAPALAGSASASSGTYTVTAGGVDIWDIADQFHFVYQPLQGDVEVIARVGSLQYADPWSKAGVMIRESLTAGSRHAAMVATGTQGWSFPRRIATGGTTYGSPYYAGAAPGWVRLVREGNLFSGYTSTDGTTWSLVSSDTITMASTVYVGLAVTSHNTGARATAAFTNVTARTVTAGSNQPPTVSISSPSTGTYFTTPATFLLEATASDPDGTITKVDLFQGSTLLKSDVTNPYSVSVTLSTAGTYQLTAVATDSDGETTTSAPVSVTVGSTTNQPPTVSLTSPASGASFTAGTNVTLQATASDTDGTVARVEFYRGSTLIGSDTTSPYSAVWSSAAAGSYSLTARAVDDDGATRTSTAVSITVTTSTNQLPTVSITSPIVGQSFAAPASLTIAAAASDSDGTIARVDFYVGTQLVGTDTSSPYTAAWSNIAAGSYSLTAVARDNAGGTRTSTAVAITVTATAPRPTTVVFVPSADHATNVTSYIVAIYRAADPVTASPVATRDIGKPAIVNGEISVDISTLVDPLPTGSYYSVVRASGPGGTTASAPSASFTK